MEHVIPHAGRATIDDVARSAGVSTATVSRALRNHPNVAENTKRRVLEVVEQLHYVTNSNASRLASGHSHTIGLLSPLLTSWYTSEVVAGVEEVLALARFDLLIGTANPAARERIFCGDARFHQRTDGIVLVDVFCSEEGATKLAELELPVVVLGEQLKSVTSVSVDNVRGARLAACHLMELGHRKLAIVGGHAHLDVAHNVPTERLEGFASALSSASLQLQPQYVEDGDFTIEGGRSAMRRLLALSDPPTAVFLMSDEMAYGAMWALRDEGLQAGHDVSIVGFDDHPVAESVGLTTVRQPVREIGRIGARLMLDALEDGGAVHHHPVELTLVARATTGAPPTN
ncbi:MAG: LacI family DNA-binding transcriptional regulator [Acidimicrobiaceae bacterium]|nr:LacI family DNA-binding transcriptional regulator [Ilumatobacter sp.]MCB9380536.1 LacI family DNA-binding transcriptional regulator [Acidimicrobiaceae bacterium]